MRFEKVVAVLGKGVFRLLPLQGQERSVNVAAYFKILKTRSRAYQTCSISKSCTRLSKHVSKDAKRARSRVGCARSVLGT